MADIDAVLQRSAREFYEQIAIPAERAHLDEVIALIALNQNPMARSSSLSISACVE